MVIIFAGNNRTYWHLHAKCPTLCPMSTSFRFSRQILIKSPVGAVLIHADGRTDMAWSEKELSWNLRVWTNQRFFRCEKSCFIIIDWLYHSFKWRMANCIKEYLVTSGVLDRAICILYTVHPAVCNSWHIWSLFLCLHTINLFTTS
jgi:hypothetical protein